MVSTGWETFLDAVIRAGFELGGTWPMRTELATAWPNELQRARIQHRACLPYARGFVHPPPRVANS